MGGGRDRSVEKVGDGRRAMGVWAEERVTPAVKRRACRGDAPASPERSLPLSERVAHRLQNGMTLARAAISAAPHPRRSNEREGAMRVIERKASV